LAEAIVQARLGNGEKSPGFSIIRIELHRAAANAHDALLAAHVAVVAGHPILPREQEEVVGLRIAGPALLDRLFFFRQKLELERTNDRLGNLVLDLEDVGELAVVALGPDMPAGLAVDELGIDPDSVAHLANASLEHVGDPELSCNVADVHRLALESECGVAGDHVE